MRKTAYSAAATAVLLLAACAPNELGPTIAIPEEIDAGSRIDAPGVRIIDVRTDGFTANWRQVTDALNYEYTFDGEEPCVTLDTNIVFTGLAVGTEHVLTVFANPRTESGRLKSPTVTVNVETSELLPLDMPALKTGSAYSSISIISWGAVPKAYAYEWELGGQRDTTTKTFLAFEGLIEGNSYTLKVRSLCPDKTQNTDSDWAETTFIPVSDGAEGITFSSFETISDAVSFNVYANSGQYWWYDCIPMVEYNRYESESAYIDSLKADLASKVAAKTESGMTQKEAWAKVLRNGSAAVTVGAYASLSYSLAVFGMDLEGNITTDITRKELRTPSDLETDGPTYLGAGGWFSQSVMLGSSSTYPPTTYISFRRIGTGVVSVNYLLYTTVKFRKTYGETLDAEAISKVLETVESSGTEASETAIEKINSASGYSAGYSNRTPGTEYTIVALAKNASGAQILAINSVKTRSTDAENSWVSYSLRSKTASSFVLRIVLASGLDAASGKFYCAKSGEVTAAYSKAEYPSMVLAKGTELTDEQISELNTQGYTDITVSDLDAATTYYVGTAITDSTSDTTVKSSNVSTK